MNINDRSQAKTYLINFFRENIKGKPAKTSTINSRHDGQIGHRLETLFNIGHNANNEADIMGYELKSETSSRKTTFGDWSPNICIYTAPKYKSVFSYSSKAQNQDLFCAIFGTPNPLKNNRYSWSGKVVPKINQCNEYGQSLIIEENKDITIYYSYSKDTRQNKNSIIPDLLKVENLVLAKWFGEHWPENIPRNKRSKTLKEKLEDKFNQLGWFTCKTDCKGNYDRICFGAPMTYDNWLDLVKEGIVFFDSGMHQGNPRPYAQWRANNTYWDSLILKTYE